MLCDIWRPSRLWVRNRHRVAAPPACGSVAVMTDESTEPQVRPAPQVSRASRAPEVPPLPNYLLDPRPIVLLGTLAWTLALLAHMLMFEVDMRTVILCAVGVGVGAVGSAVYALQRRAVLRGSAGAQAGLDFADEPEEKADEPQEK